MASQERTLCKVGFCWKDDWTSQHWQFHTRGEPGFCSPEFSVDLFQAESESGVEQMTKHGVPQYHIGRHLYIFYLLDQIGICNHYNLNYVYPETETAEETEFRKELEEKYPKEPEEKIQKNQFSSTERSTQTKIHKYSSVELQTDPPPVYVIL